jgi:hypothetical protein
MEISAAVSAGYNLDENLALRRRQNLPSSHNEQVSRAIEHHGAHRRHTKSVTRIERDQNPGRDYLRLTAVARLRCR